MEGILNLVGLSQFRKFNSILTAEHGCASTEETTGFSKDWVHFENGAQAWTTQNMLLRSVTGKCAGISLVTVTDRSLPSSDSPCLIVELSEMRHIYLRWLLEGYSSGL